MENEIILAVLWLALCIAVVFVRGVLWLVRGNKD